MYTVDSGDTAFILLCTALVCLMTPGLAFFYGGLVRRKNVLTIMMQSFISMGVIAVIWIFGGFSLAFGPDVGGVIGDITYHFALDKVGAAPSPDYATTVPFLLFFAYQLMFAIITPALITGAFAGRFNFRGYLQFLVLWMIFVYIPACHWIWGGGFLAGLGVVDFAGGIVVHVNAGFAALATVFFLGRRDDVAPGAHPEPNNLPLVAVGAGLLWFGWFGFNAGSAFAANGTAGYAWVSTSAATAAAMLSWGFTEKIRTGHYTAMGAASGIVAGLVAITPAADVVSPLWAIVLGAIAGVLTCLACGLKFKLGYDDSLDVVGVHGVGGFTGTVLIGFFGEGTGLFAGGDWRQLVVQLIVALVAIVWSAVITGIIAFALEKTIGWRVTEAQEVGGIDLADQGERAYDFAGTASSVLKEVK